jgi:hypothetical protein
MICDNCKAEIGDSVLTIFEQLPHGDLELFDSAGQVLFPIYAASGGLASEQILYIIRIEGTHGGKSLGIRFRNKPSVDETRDALVKGIANFNLLAHDVSFDGADLGRGIDVADLLK